jgi:radical SAM protein with 4Fe4S-binding SPASM domain
LSEKARQQEEEYHLYLHTDQDDCFFASCAGNRNEFHIDPYGQLTFCSFIKDPALRYDLKKGNFREGWDDFLPSLKDKIKGGTEYAANCGSCDLKEDCRWCPAYGFLEHRRFSAKIDYLCEVARENKKFKKNWEKSHQRYYGIAGLTLRVDSDLPITEKTFHPKFKIFEVDESGEDMISIHHSFFLPEIKIHKLGKKIYERPPWAIFRKGKTWIYLSISPTTDYDNLSRVAVINDEHTRARIYSPGEKLYRKGNIASLTFFPTDQILLARALANREGCYLHSSGVSLDNKGLLFVGHSDAGKSTMVQMLMGEAKILCDDRIIVRRHSDGFKIYGTWSHGDIPDVSPDSAPLQAILFLKKDKTNRIVRMEDPKDVLPRLLACLIKPFVSPDWWDKMLTLVGKIAREVPCYELHFDKSGKIVDLLKKL